MLYIDDEIDLLDIAKDFLQEEYLAVDISSNVDEALQMIKTNYYDIIVSDEKMPSGSGTEFLNFIKEQKLFSGKAILVTGEIPDPNSLRPYDCAILKPIHFEELAHSIYKILN